MAQIVLSDINKTFRVAKRQAGFGRAVKALFSREHEIIRALENVSFQIDDGEMVGYIGPNGAGKSTTIKIMCGVLTPDSGTCIINGRTPWKERSAHVRGIGVVFGQRRERLRQQQRGNLEITGFFVVALSKSNDSRS